MHPTPSASGAPGAAPASPSAPADAADSGAAAAAPAVTGADTETDTRADPPPAPRGDLAPFAVTAAEAGQTLAAVLRGRLGGSWNSARGLCEGGKVFLRGQVVLDPARRMSAGEPLEVRRRAKAPLSPVQRRACAAIVHEDTQIVVIDKPAGLSSVPYERGDTDTAMDLVRSAWRVDKRQATEQPLHIVHRIDKETSGLLLFAKTRQAERSLQALWRAHDIERRYLCIVHGRMTSRRIESYFVTDRGDGLRGSLRPGMKVSGGGTGKHAVTHVEALEVLGQAPGPVVTLCAVRIETGKTHQIRIHMAEAGHPIVGEEVYIRDYVRRGQTPIEAPRLMLHAETLGVAHPATGEQVRWVSEPPPPFRDFAAKLRRSGQSAQIGQNRQTSQTGAEPMRGERGPDPRPQRQPEDRADRSERPARDARPAPTDRPLRPAPPARPAAQDRAAPPARAAPQARASAQDRPAPSARPAPPARAAAQDRPAARDRPATQDRPAVQARADRPARRPARAPRKP